MSTLGRPQRQHRILRILESQPVSSQGQLVQLLEAEGVVTTQVTVSRDLEELGAVKVRIPGGAMAYAIPDFTRERAPSDDHLRRLMSEFVVEVAVLPRTSRVVSGFFLFVFELDFFFGLSVIMSSIVCESSSSMLFGSVAGVSSGCAVGLLVTTKIS